MARLGLEYFTLGVSLAPYEILMSLHLQVFQRRPEERGPRVAGVPFGPRRIPTVIEVKMTFREVGLGFGDVALTSFAQRDICFCGARIVSRPLWLHR